MSRLERLRAWGREPAGRDFYMVALAVFVAFTDTATLLVLAWSAHHARQPHVVEAVIDKAVKRAVADQLARDEAAR